MDNEYIIVNKTAIQKRIEELGKQYILLSNKSDRSLSDIEEEREIVGELQALSNLLSQSTPLIPELQKTWNAAYTDALSIDEETYKPLFFEDYISNLKLDI